MGRTRSARAFIDSSCLVAIALFLAPDPRQLTFLTLDVRQRSVAKQLGFKV